MATAYYPVYLDVEGRTAVVIGGGTIAEGKVTGLLEAGARVVVVSPTLTQGLRQLASDGTISWTERTYEPGDLKDAWLGIAATDDPPINVAVAREGAQRHILVNVVDKPALCTFIAPAVVRRGDLTLAISTNGKSPAMARRMREELERLVPPEYGELLAVVAAVRADFRKRGLSAPQELWQRALGMDLLGLVRDGRTADATALLTRTLLSGATAGTGANRLKTSDE